MKKAGILLFLLLFLSGHQLMSQKPNIVFILVDDLGCTDLSCLGSNYYETPNVDHIASDGLVFTQGYAASAVCSPSRASIMSGKFTARHGITDWIGAKEGADWREMKRYNKLLPSEYVRELPAEYTTMAEAIKKEKYITFFAGKWHLGGIGSFPEDHGFDINMGGNHNGSPVGGYFSPYDNPQLQDTKKGENLSIRLANETVKFIEANQDTTFFAFLSFYAVHGPIQTTQAKWAKYQEKALLSGITETGFKMGHFLPIRQIQDNPVYAGLIETMDDAVGLVLNCLKKLNLEENTIVIFTSDNGGVAAGDSYSTSNYPCRAGKGYQYEGGTRVPYIIKVPWMQGSKGKTCDIPVTGADFYPTLLDLIGGELYTNEHIDGISLKPILQTQQGDTERSLFWHYPHYGNQGGEPSSIIRKGDWKLIHYYEDGHEELYNLKTDVGETHNMSNKMPEIAAEMSKELFAFLKSVNAKIPLKDPEYDAEKEKMYLHFIAKEKLEELEKQRMHYLNNGFIPNQDWWGSSYYEE